MSDKVSERVRKSDAQPLVAFHVQQRSDVNEDRWKSEIFNKIIEIKAEPELFLQTFVPSSRPVPPTLPKLKRGYFHVPHDVPEPQMYGPMVRRTQVSVIRTLTYHR